MGEVYLSHNKGGSWTRLVTLGTGESKSLITGLAVDPVFSGLQHRRGPKGTIRIAGQTFEVRQRGF